MSFRDGNLMFSDEVLCPKRGEAEPGLPPENWRHYGQLQRADSSKQVSDLTRAGISLSRGELGDSEAGPGENRCWYEFRKCPVESRVGLVADPLKGGLEFGVGPPALRTCRRHRSRCLRHEENHPANLRFLFCWLDGIDPRRRRSSLKHSITSLCVPKT
jgi:hypothetical protein